jgi:hypothetical protein
VATEWRTGLEGVVWVFAPAGLALVAFAWMIDHGWAAWHREAQRPGER